MPDYDARGMPDRNARVCLGHFLGRSLSDQAGVGLRLCFVARLAAVVVQVLMAFGIRFNGSWQVTTFGKSRRPGARRSTESRSMEFSRVQSVSCVGRVREAAGPVIVTHVGQG